MPTVTGVGPRVKKSGSFKMFIQGSGFSVGDAVRLAINVSGGTQTRTGRIVQLVSGGAIAKIDPKVSGEEKSDPVDDDLAEIEVTVTNSEGESGSTTETGTIGG